MPIPVSLTVNAMTDAASVQACVVRAPAAFRHFRHERSTSSVLGELKSVRQQVFQHLTQTLDVGLHSFGQAVVQLDHQLETFVLAIWLNVRSMSARRSVKCNVADLDAHRAGFDFRQIEDLVDQREQIGSRRVDRFGELDLFFVESVCPGFPPASSRG